MPQLARVQHGSKALSFELLSGWRYPPSLNLEPVGYHTEEDTPESPVLGFQSVLVSVWNGNNVVTKDIPVAEFLAFMRFLAETGGSEEI